MKCDNMEVKTALVLFLLHGVVISAVLARPGKPTLQQCPDKIVNPGDTVTWTCVANSADRVRPDSHRWYKKRGRYYYLIPGEKGRTFTRSVRQDDAGYYRCKTVIGSDSSELGSYKKLIVNDKISALPQVSSPISLTLHWFPSSGSINVGDTLNIICLADPNKGVPSYFELWCKHDKAVDKIVSPTFQESSISQVQAVMWSKSVNLKDKGDYFCRAVYPCGLTDDSLPEPFIDVKAAITPTVLAPARLTMKWFPDPDTRQITVGDTLIVLCRTAPGGGRPASYELWCKHDGGDAGLDNCTSTFSHVNTAEDKGQGHGVMFYKSVALSDSGEYYCRAINTAGSTNSSDQPLTVSGKVSEIAASFRSTKTFTKKLLDETTQEYKDMKEYFEPLLQNAFRSKVASGEMKGVIITGFEEGSVIVHYRIILKVSVEITDTSMNPAVVSTILANYLKDNPNEAKKYDIAPGSAGIDGGTKDSHTSPEKSLQNKVDVISAITATLIVILIVTVVVLVVYSIRLKRQVMVKQSSGDGVEYNAGVNGNGQAEVKVKKTNRLDADNTYAAIGEKEPVIINDLYQSLGEQKRIAKPQVSMVSRENAAFETDEAVYVNIGKAVFSTVEGKACVDDDYATPDGESNVNHGNRA